jgi:hypothetical protein
MFMFMQSSLERGMAQHFIDLRHSGLHRAAGKVQKRSGLLTGEASEEAKFQNCSFS